MKFRTFFIIVIILLISWSFLHIEPENAFENKTIDEAVLKLKVLDAKLNQDFLKSQLRLSSINYDVINFNLRDIQIQKEILTNTIKNINAKEIENSVEIYLDLSKQKEEYLETLKSETAVLSNSLHYLNTDYLNLKQHLVNADNRNSLEYLHNNLILYNLNPNNVDLENEISLTIQKLVLLNQNSNENAEFIENFLGHSFLVLENTKLLHKLTQKLNKLPTVNALENIENANNAMRRREQTVVYQYQILLAISTLLLSIGIIHAVRRYDKSTMLLEESLYALERQKYAVDQHAIVSMADKEGVIIYANENFIAISGYSSEELIGQNHRLLNSGYHSKEFFTEMWATISNGNVWGGKLCNRNKSGNLYWVQSTIVPFVNLDGTVNHYISIRTDITLQKKMEIAAVEASNLKSDFLSNMSHEIRTPMNGIIGMTDILLDTSLDEEQLEFVNIIKNSSRSLLTIINDILDFSKIEAGKLTIETIDFSLQNVLESCADIIANRAYEKSLMFITFIDPKIPDKMLGDPIRLQQIILNFLSNAIKFTAKGSVNLNAKLINKTDSNVLILIEIIDTGIGISVDTQEHLFQPFSQADSSTTRKYGGTGLGLSISKHLTELMGGKIGLNSVLEKGSTFWIELPFAISQQDVEIQSSCPAALDIVYQTPKNENLILLVEDNVVNQQVAKHVLLKLGYTIDIANNGQEALDLLESAHYELVLMDCQMPIMDGFEATGWIRKREQESDNRKRIPIIAMTANAIEGDRERCLKSGMDDYVSKPINRGILADVLKKWLPND